MTWTPYPELDEVVGEVAQRAADVLGDNLVGVYLEGSFALGAGDLYSDVDFLVVMTTPLDRYREARLRAFHRELPTRPGHWARHVEGSYAVLGDLLDPGATGREWLFIDHGAQEMTWDSHGNDMVHRWVLREHGIVIAGPAPAAVVAAVEPRDLQREALRELQGFPGSLLAWLDLDIAWAQRYFVVAYCRVLVTLVSGRVASKSDALRWAADTLDPKWRPLLRQTLVDRPRGLSRADPPRPGSVDSSLEFAAYAQQWALVHPAHRHPGPHRWTNR